jgi:hypothetical protein
VAVELAWARLVFIYEMTVLPQSSGGTTVNPPTVPVAYRITARDRITIMIINTAIIPLFPEINEVGGLSFLGIDEAEVLSFFAMNNYSFLL